MATPPAGSTGPEAKPDEGPAVDVAVADNGKLHMLNQRGEAVLIPRESLGDAIAKGYTPETSEDVVSREIRTERETFGEQAKTFGEGALRGATLGLGTAALAELGGEDYRRAARERLETNPGVAVAGELAGAVAPALISGGAGAAGSVARAAPVSIASRAGGVAEHLAGRLLAPLGESLGAKVVRGAIEMGAGGLVEGAAYGLGSSLADSALEGTEWTAERAISGLEHGALYGATGGALVGAAAPVLSKVSRKVLDKMVGEGKTFRQAVSEWADKRVVSNVVGDDARIFRTLTDDGADMSRLERVADKIRATGITSADELPRALAKQADEAVRIRGEVVKQLDDFGVKPALAPEAVDELVDGIGRMRSAGTSDHTAIADKLEKTLGTFQRREGETTFADLFKLRTGLDDVARFARSSKNVAQEETSKLVENLTRRMDAAADAPGAEFGRLWRESQQNASDLLLLKEGIIGSAERKAMKKAAGGSEFQTGLIGALGSLVMSGGATLPAIATGLVSSAAHRFVRERGAAGLGWLADRVARVELRTSNAAKALAGIEGNVVKKAANYGVNARDVAERRELRETLGKGLRRAATVAGVHGNNPNTDAGRAKRFDTLRSTALEMSRDPNKLAARVQRAIAPFADSQPEVAQALGRRMIRDHLYLMSKLPVTSSSIGETLTPGADKPMVSRYEQDKWLRAHDALEDVPGAVESLAAGEINWEAADAIKENRPELWASLGQKVLLEAAKREEELPYNRKVYLSILFDFPTDWSMTPAGMSAIAEASEYQPPGEENQGPGRGSPSSLDAGEIGGAMQTAAQAATGAP